MKLKLLQTRKSSCMNARGLLTTAYQVLLSGVLPLLGYPHQDTPLARSDKGVSKVGYPPSQGTPHQGTPCWGTPHQGTPTWTWLGYPLPGPGSGTPPTWTWLGYPLPGPGSGIPPPGPGWGTPLGVDRQTDACQNITFLILCTRSVIICSSQL